MDHHRVLTRQYNRIPASLDHLRLVRSDYFLKGFAVAAVLLQSPPEIYGIIYCVIHALSTV